MSVFKRMSDVVQQKLNAVLDKNEDPNQALDFAYQKQLESLQQVRRNVADVLTAEKRLELQEAQLKQSADKLNAQAQQALQQGREDLARLALTRAQTAQAQIAGLDQQIQQMKDQEQKLERGGQQRRHPAAAGRGLDHQQRGCPARAHEGAAGRPAARGCRGPDPGRRPVPAVRGGPRPAGYL